MTNEELKRAKEQIFDLDTSKSDPAEMSDCEKYKMFVEDNYMLEFMIWEDYIMNLKFDKSNDDECDIIDITID